MKHLKELLKETSKIEVRGNRDISIKGLCANSKTAVPGDLFIAKRGLQTDGSRYISDAIDAGAVAVLTDLYDSNFSHITQLITSDVASVESELACEFFGRPSDQLFMVGVTGTNGKTTTAYLIQYLLTNLKGLCGLIGTVEYSLGNRSVPATHTTPDVTSNQRLLWQMVNNHCQSAVMEVSSHALTQGRVKGIDFDVAVYTNLSQDHLDYHHTMEDYARAKSLLFREMSNLPKDEDRVKAVVVNLDDPYAELMVNECSVPQLTYGIDSDADLLAKNISLEESHTFFTVCYKGEEYSCRIPLIGRYNVYNALAAMGVALTQGFSIESVIASAASFPSVPGRMEMVKNSLGLRVVVDFAHTEDALDNALSCVREMQPHRLITVFGCGGDRDRGKRPKMGSVSGKWSDVSIVTSDNPRTEDPLAIISEVVAGFSEGQEYVVEPDRKSAIMRAIQMATPQDIVVIAGKGHETTQVISHRGIEFDDRKVAASIMENSL